MQKVILTLLAALLPLPGLAATPYGDNPERLSRLHCQLLLRSAAPNTPINAGLLDTMTGDAGPGSRTLTEIKYLTKGWPDMGFILGKRWAVAPRAERIAFDRGYAAELVKRYAIQAPSSAKDYRRTCLMDVTVTAADPTPDHSEEKLPGVQRHYHAKAKTNIAGGNSTLMITYHLEKEPGYDWRITELWVGKDNLLQTDGTRFNRIVARSGFVGLMEELTAPSAGGAGHAPATPTPPPTAPQQ